MNKHWLSPNWPAPANVHAATLLRTGGLSCGAYASLNPAMHVGDDPEKVIQNRQLIKQWLSLPDEPIWLDQIHSNRAVQAVRNTSLVQADASYTTDSGVVCAVLTADCLPLLVCTTDGNQIAAIHAGWRGLLAGVIGNTIAAMETSFNRFIDKRDFLIWLGPAIGPNYFEVGTEVQEAFLNKSDTFDPAFKQQSNNKWLADIYQLARIDLKSLGINQIYGGNFCTFSEPERFYSYRRDKQTGRMATLIWRE